MADWRTVETRIWKDDWFKRLCPFDRNAWIMLLTNPDTQATGIYRLSDSDACHYLKCSLTKWRAFQTLAEGLEKAFFSDGWVYVRHFTAHQPPLNPNILTAGLRKLTDCPKSLLHRALANPSERLPIGLRKGIKRLSLETETETETETERERETSLSPKNAKGIQPAPALLEELETATAGSVEEAVKTIIIEWRAAFNPFFGKTQDEQAVYLKEARELQVKGVTTESLIACWRGYRRFMGTDRPQNKPTWNALIGWGRNHSWR